MKKLLKNKKIIFIALVILLITIITATISTVVINKVNESEYKEDPSSFTWEEISFVLNDDYSYTFTILITAKEQDGIETIRYEQNGKEKTLNCKGKNIVAIDYKAVENKDYEFKVKPVGKSERTEVINIQRKVAGKDTYKLVKGVYLNTPFLENFNSKYTRYVYQNEKLVLTPGNWIYNTEPTQWYDYNNQEWANVYVETEGTESYYVWIPRYVYKQDVTNSTSGNERVDVKFVDVYNNYIDATTGKTITYAELVNDGYQLPEAFQWGDIENNGITTAISGYWISKYQLSELSAYSLNYNIVASTNKIVVKNFTNNVSTKASKYTYAINGTIKNESATLDEYSFIDLTQNESYTVNVTALNDNGTIVGSMTKTLEPTQVNEPDLSKFDPTTTFYVYWDEDGTEHSDIPISEPAPSNWYNYTYSNWANVVTKANGTTSYFVWIPRYQYKLNNTSQRVDIKFIEGISTTSDEGYTIPEAFWWDANDNGVEDDGEQLTGYWISKYQLSN